MSDLNIDIPSFEFTSGDYYERTTGKNSYPEKSDASFPGLEALQRELSILLNRLHIQTSKHQQQAHIEREEIKSHGTPASNRKIDQMRGDVFTIYRKMMDDWEDYPEEQIISAQDLVNQRILHPKDTSESDRIIHEITEVWYRKFDKLITMPEELSKEQLKSVQQYLRRVIQLLKIDKSLCKSGVQRESIEGKLLTLEERVSTELLDLRLINLPVPHGFSRVIRRIFNTIQ